jgi:hypothetical protein
LGLQMCTTIRSFSIYFKDTNTKTTRSVTQLFCHHSACFYPLM